MPTNVAESFVANDVVAGCPITCFGWVYATNKTGNPAVDATVAGKITMNGDMGVVHGHRIGSDVPENLKGDIDMMFSLATKQVCWKTPAGDRE